MSKKQPNLDHHMFLASESYSVATYEFRNRPTPPEAEKRQIEQMVAFI